MTQDSVSGGAATGSESKDSPYFEPSFLDALPYYLPLGIFPLLVLALLYGGWWMLPPFLYMSLASSLDRVFGPDGKNMTITDIAERRLISYNIPLWTWAILWPPTLVLGLWQILYADAFAIWEDVILACLLTMEAQAVFIVGHELVHRRTMWERRIGELLLASASYPQYATEHVYIHHASVGTPHDVGSALKGEGFWRYFPKELASNLTNSWRVSGEKLSRLRRSRWHYSNPFWRYCIYLAGWYTLVVLLGGFWALPVYVFLGLSCVFSMKISNYFQHYGLRRIQLSNGRWERIAPHHSWSADWKFTNWMFFKIQRHADHHARVTRQYPQLQSRVGESPELPGTYGEMMSLALRPKQWFLKMDPLLDQWRKQLHPQVEDWSPYDSPVVQARPDAFEAIVEIFSLAPRLAKWIERHPELLDNLRIPEFTDLDLPKGFLSHAGQESIARRGLARLYWTHEMGVQEMQDLIDELPATHAKEKAEVLRNWSNDKVFQIGMHLVRGNLSPAEARVAMSNLAESSIVSVIAEVVDELVDRVGSLQVGAVAVVLLGDLASKDVCSDTAMEVLLLHEGWHDRQVARLERRFQETLVRLTRDSLLFAPIEEEENLALSMPISEVVEHCQSPSMRDLPVLARSRCAFEFGELDLGRRFMDIRQSVLSEYSKNESLLSRLIEGNGKESESETSTFESMSGGLDELERTASYAQLTSDRLDSTDTAPTATKIFEQTGSVPLKEAASVWRDLLEVSSLVHGRGVDLDDAPPKVKTLVAKACGHPDYDSLNSSITTVAHDAATEIESLVKNLRP